MSVAVRYKTILLIVIMLYKNSKCGGLPKYSIYLTYELLIHINDMLVKMRTHTYVVAAVGHKCCKSGAVAISFGGARRLETKKSRSHPLARRRLKFPEGQLGAASITGD